MAESAKPLKESKWRHSWAPEALKLKSWNKIQKYYFCAKKVNFRKITEICDFLGQFRVWNILKYSGILKKYSQILTFRWLPPKRPDFHLPNLTLFPFTWSARSELRPNLGPIFKSHFSINNFYSWKIKIIFYWFFNACDEK